jgi:hypothetical protein
MKKSIIIAVLLLFAATAFCQTTPPVVPPTPPNPTFKLDLTQPVQLDIKFKLPGNVVNDYLLYQNVGEAAINHAGDISSARATEIKDNHKLVLDSLQAGVNRSWFNLISAQQKKFTADTTAVKKGGIKK